MKYCGIDCGLIGAIGFSDGSFANMPVINHYIDSKKVVSSYGIYKILKDYRPDFIAIEEQQPQGNKTSRIACFTMGRNYESVLRGVTDYAEEFSCKLIMVKPAVWKKTLGVETEKLVKDKKAKTINLMNHIFGLTLKKTQDGIADALALAEYARRKY